VTVLTIIGAGSTVFAAELMSDFLSTPEIDSGEFRLIDIDPERLGLAHEFAEYLIERSGRNWTVSSDVDRTALIPGSDVIISTIEVAGLSTVDHDYVIPLRFGVDQCIGDTIGPGGLFKSLRTIPTFLEILRDIERLAPDALVLNHTNPMSMTILAASRASTVPVWGMCHSVHHTIEDLAGYLEQPQESIRFDAAGVNHLAWITTLEQDGVDLYPRLRERGRRPEVYERDPVRFDLMYQLGAFPTESSGHVSEYLPYFRTHRELVASWEGRGYIGESGFYARNWPAWRLENDQLLRSVLQGTESYALERGPEYPSRIVAAMQGGKPADSRAETTIYVTTPNRGWIENVHQDNAVEVAATVDENGIHPQAYGSLPEHLASWVRRHQEFNDLAVTSILTEDREAAVQALMIDPLTSAACELDQIRAMFDEMVAAERDHLPSYLW